MPTRISGAEGVQKQKQLGQQRNLHTLDLIALRFVRHSVMPLSHVYFILRNGASGP
jgi:hypothetical protein